MWNSVTVSGYREIYLAGTANINEEAGYSITIINSPISGPGGLTINGDSNTRFGGNNTYDGDTHILTGRLSLTFRRDTTDPNNTIEQVSTSLPYGPGKGNVIIDAGAELNIQDAWTCINGLYGAGNILKTESTTKNLTIGNADRDGDYSGTIGPGLAQNLISITKVGAGTQYFRAVDSGYTAATTITAGTLAVAKMDIGGAVSSIGVSSAASSSLTIGSDVDTATATLKYIGTGDTTDRRFSVGLSAAFDSSGAGPIQFLPATGSTMGYIGTGVHTVTLTGTNTGDNIMDVRLVDTDSPTNLVKSGSGKWMSTINHTYKGNTTVLNGILDLMDINTPDATVSVAAGELDASSIVANTLTVGNGATVVIKAISGGGTQAGMESLSPVPEPSTWALLILAALVFGIYRRRSR
jgi:fibronectin-binding autotransporter adhesin